MHMDQSPSHRTEPTPKTLYFFLSKYLTMVALDEDGKPALVPPLLAVTASEQRRMREAELRRANRLAEREEILSNRAQESD